MRHARLSDGFAVGYARDKGSFRVYILGLASAGFLATAAAGGGLPALLLGSLAGGTAYYFYPLIETNKPRLGAGQYGLFVDGFGVIAWRAVEDLLLRTYAVRSIEQKELHIKLREPLERALVADWRRPPWYRMAMRVPWAMTHDNVVRINLEPFPGPPEDLHRELTRVRKFFG